MAIKCSVCGYENPDDAGTCLNCGSPLERQRLSEPIDDISGEATVLVGQQFTPPQEKSSPPPSPPPGSGQQAGGSVPPPHTPSMGQGGPMSPGTYPGAGSQEAAGAGLPPPNLPNSTTLLILSIVEIICCCLPLGVVALVFSILGMNAEKSGDFQKAADHLKLAKIFVIIGIAGGLIIGVAYFFLVIAGAALGG